jgi:hypothetical protein
VQDGSLVTKYLNVQRGNFLFTNNNVGLNFAGFDGIFEMVWKADKHTHHTEILTSQSDHTCLGISGEIPSTPFKLSLNYSTNIMNIIRRSFSMIKINLFKAAKYGKKNKHKKTHVEPRKHRDSISEICSLF